MAGRRNLKSLNDRHLAVCRMKIEGASHDEICQVVGCTKSTLYVWMCEPLIKAELKRMRQDIDDLFVERMSSLGMRALGKLEDLADLELEDDTRLSAAQKLEILREILDRVPQTRKAQPVSAGGNVSLNLNNYGDPPPEMTDEQLLAMAAATAKALPVGTTTVVDD